MDVPKRHFLIPLEVPPGRKVFRGPAGLEVSMRDKMREKRMKGYVGNEFGVKSGRRMERKSGKNHEGQGIIVNPHLKTLFISIFVI